MQEREDITARLAKEAARMWSGCGCRCSAYLHLESRPEFVPVAAAGERSHKACAGAVKAVKFLQAADMYVQVGEPSDAWIWRCYENNERSKDLTEQVMDTANMVRHYLGIRDWHLGQRTSEGSVEQPASNS